MDSKTLAICVLLMVLLFSAVDRSDAGIRLCLGTRSTCRDNPRLIARGGGCSLRRPGHVCRPYGFNSCRCLPGLDDVLASEGDLETDSVLEKEDQ